MALQDGLTGVPNRRAFDFAIANEYRRSQREGIPLSLLMIDIDYFKAYNDFYGHSRGDEVLTRVAVILRSCLARPTDSLFRYGGEEFAVMLADTDSEGARFIADKLVSKIRQIDILHERSQFRRLTISVGVATQVNGDKGLFYLIEQADKALYAAKRAGRNQYRVATNNITYLDPKQADKT